MSPENTTQYMKQEQNLRTLYEVQVKLHKRQGVEYFIVKINNI